LLEVSGASWALPGTPYCPRGHKMDRLAATRCTRKPVCDGCGRPNLHEGSGVFWTCWPCDHDVCVACSGVAPVICMPGGPEDVCEEVKSFTELTDMDGWQALHYAAAAGRSAATKSLLEARALPSSGDSSGMAPLHWAALSGRVEVVDVLLEHGAPAGDVDLRGRPPLALMPAEALRYAYAEEESEEDETLADQITVAGAGEADGMYFQAQAGGKGLNKGIAKGAGRGSSRRTVPTGTQAPADSDAATGSSAPARSSNGQAPVSGEGGTGEEPAAENSQQNAEATEAADSGRPTYRRADGSPFRVMWKDGEGWGLYKQDEVIFKSRSQTKRCPASGWGPAEAKEATLSTVMVVADASPWSTGRRLLKATPPERRPPELRDTVNALPSRQAVQRPTHQAVRIPIPGGFVTIEAGAVPVLFQGVQGGTVEHLLEGMVRAGALPPEPPPECRQQ